MHRGHVVHRLRRAKYAPSNRNASLGKFHGHCRSVKRY